MTKPKGKAVSIAISDLAESDQCYRAQYMAMTMEDGSVWFRFKSMSRDWEWTEWECIYAPESA